MKKWNLEKASKMYAKGKTLAEVGAHFGLSRTSTSKRLRAAGVKTRGRGAAVRAVKESTKPVKAKKDAMPVKGAKRAKKAKPARKR